MDPIDPAKEKRLRAWEIHKEADGLLHSRLASFATSQSFLVAGYILCLTCSQNGYEKYLAELAWCVAGLGVAVSVGFGMIGHFLVRGLNKLKEKYLLPSDPVYEDFLTVVYRGSSRDSLKAVQEGPLRWFIPLYFPTFIGTFWVLAIALRLALLR